MQVQNTSFINPVTVRHFMDPSDLKDIIGAMPGGTQFPTDSTGMQEFVSKLVLYKVEGDDAYNTATTNYKYYTLSTDNQTADLQHFTLHQYQNLYYLQFQVSEFSSGALAYAPGVAPITLETFTGSLQNGIAKLQWQTGIETNFNHFEIEKAIVIDSQAWQLLGKVPAKGSNSGYTYDVTQAEPTAYYRLKIADKYSNIIVCRKTIKTLPFVRMPPVLTSL